MVNNRNETKEIIIASLKKASGAVSGTALGKNAGISRVAVWKNIKGLTAEGYKIASSSDGYRLLNHDSSDSLIRREFTEIKERIYTFPLVDSTMEKARELALKGAPHMALAAADEQSNGRDRKQIRWESKPGGLYFTLILRPGVKLHRYHLYTLAAAAGISIFLESYGIKGVCRWPNQVYAGGKKIAGILTEISGTPEKIEYMLLGIGVNINNDSAGSSIKQITGKEVPLNSALKNLFGTMEKTFSMHENKIPALWESRSDLIIPKGGNRITPDGNMLIKEKDSTEKRVYPGDFI